MILKVVMVALAWFGTAGQAQQPFELRDLTVPVERLPAGCILSPAPVANEGGNRLRGGLWAGLPITSNPWTGTDRLTIATIRERIEGPQPGPDAPPLSRSELSRFRLALADGVDEGYAAVYLFESRVIVVYGLRFAATYMNVGFPTTPRLTGIRIGPIVAYLDGNGGSCSRAVEAHLSALAKQVAR